MYDKPLTNLTNIRARLCLGNLPDPHHGQGGQGEGGDQPPQDLAPGRVDILALVIGGCTVVYQSEGPDNLQKILSKELGQYEALTPIRQGALIFQDRVKNIEGSFPVMSATFLARRPAP